LCQSTAIFKILKRFDHEADSCELHNVEYRTLPFGAFILIGHTTSLVRPSVCPSVRLSDTYGLVTWKQKSTEKPNVPQRGIKRANF